MHIFTAIPSKIISLSLLLFILSACGSDPDNKDAKATDGPTFTPIKNQDKVIIIGDAFDIPLQVSNPNSSPLVFDFAEIVLFPDTHNRVNTSTITDATFTWTPIPSELDPLRSYTQFNEEFVVTDSAVPVPFQASQKVVFTVVDVQAGLGGKIYMTHCAECHGVSGDGAGAFLPDGSAGIGIIFLDLVLLGDLNNTSMRNLMSTSASTSVTQMQYLNDILVTSEDISAVVDYVYSLRP